LIKLVDLLEMDVETMKNGAENNYTKIIPRAYNYNLLSKVLGMM